MENRLAKQIDFILEVDKAKDVFRRTLLSNNKRYENDAEHSFHLALMAPLLKEYVHDDIDIAKVMNMVIIHDLVEIDAGDTYCYDVKGYETKEDREKSAADRIFNILPKDQAEIIYSLWVEFEEMKTIESRYAACLDRLQPLLLNKSTNFITWKMNKPKKCMILERLNIIKETSNELWSLAESIVNEGVEKGYITT